MSTPAVCRLGKQWQHMLCQGLGQQKQGKLPHLLDFAMPVSVVCLSWRGKTALLVQTVLSRAAGGATSLRPNTDRYSVLSGDKLAFGLVEGVITYDIPGDLVGTFLDIRCALQMHVLSTTLTLHAL